MNPNGCVVSVVCFGLGAVCLFFAFWGNFSIVLFVIGALLVLGGIGSLLPDKKAGRDQGDDGVYSFNVAGVSYRQDAICELCLENDDWSVPKQDLIDMGMIDERIYQYSLDACVASLVPEPENEYDKNAVRVMHRNILLGYVPKEETTSVRRFISDDYAVSVSAYGGPYKTIVEDEDGSYSVEKVQQTVGLRATIRCK